MQEKDMVNDILSMTNSSLTSYAAMITQSSNPTLRQTLQQLRNDGESFQYNLYKIAEQKGYYKPSANATPEDVRQVQTIFTAATTK